VVVGRTDARERNGRPAFTTAVSLRVQPQLVLALRAALVRAPGIKAAFVYGSAATSAPSPSLPKRRKRGREAHSAPAGAIDLMVIGDATHADCFAGLLDAENVLKRRIHARFVSAAEWNRKLARKSAFFTKVNAQPRIFIFASADDLRR
jgi:hypothetical protein